MKNITFYFLICVSFALLSIDAVSQNQHSTPKTELSSTEDSIEILLPLRYRIFDDTDPVQKLNKNWLELYEKKGEYYLAKPKYHIKKDFDECAGLQCKTIKRKRNALLFFSLSIPFNGKINHVNITQPTLLPGDVISFEFNAIRYVLRAEGNLHDSSCAEYCISDYKLFIRRDGYAEQQLLYVEKFENSQAKISFLGDIDGDGKLDIILDAATNYEENRALLFLSSKAIEKMILKLVAETVSPFDC